MRETMRPMRDPLGTRSILALSIMVIVSTALLFAIPGADGTIIVVDGAGPWADHDNIQDAIDASTDGDEILIFEGTYYENIVVNRSLTITGNGTAYTTIDATMSGTGILVGSNMTEISGIAIRNASGKSGFAGVRVRSDENTLVNCSISECQNGIVLSGSDGNYIANMTINATVKGISMIGSNNNSIENVEIFEPNNSTMVPPEHEQNDEGVIHFAVAADQHYGWKDQTIPYSDGETVMDWMSHPDLPEFDFVISSMGDWISDNRATGVWRDTDHCWEKITDHNANNQSIPYFFVFGNHDITNYDNMVNGNPVRKERTGRNISGLNENNYAFLYDNVLFICAAQTNCLYQLSGFQHSWIEYLVKRYSDHTTIILTHQAFPETTGYGDSRATSWNGKDYGLHNDVEWWHELFRSNPQIKMYMHGHKEKGYNTTVLDLHTEDWDDDCSFVLVPSNGRGTYEPDQGTWSYIFEVTNDSIGIELWDSETDSYLSDQGVGVPYTREGLSNNVSAEGMEWFSIPKRLLDDQSWTWKNHFIADSYHVELVGSNVTEQLDNADLEGFDPYIDTKGLWYAVRGDENALNKGTGETDGYIEIEGGRRLRIATSPSNTGKHIEGNVPYNTAIAIPGGTYNFSCRVRTKSGSGSIDLLVSIPTYLNLDEYVWKNVPVRSDVSVGPSWTTYWKTFTVPDDDDMWFIQPKIHFDTGAVYRLDSWSLMMDHGSDGTEDFTIELNGQTFGHSGTLGPHEYIRRRVPNSSIGNSLNLSCSIGGNHVGLFRLIYERPKLWSDDVTFGVLNDAQTKVWLEDRSPYNNRTTVMTFNGGTMGIDGFGTTVVRGKYLYTNNGYDRAIDGLYTLRQTGSAIGIHACGSSNNSIRNVSVEGYPVGIHIDSGRGGSIENCTVLDTDIGIRISGSSEDVNIRNSSLVRNDINIMNLARSDVDSSFNHWGSVDAGIIMESVIDRHDDGSYGWVCFDPWYDALFGTVYTDPDPPITRDDHDGPWHMSNVTLHLNATDLSTGVAATYYQIDNGSWTTGTTLTIPAPTDHSNDGDHTISYYSIDIVGNTEQVHTIHVGIDTTTPDLVIFFDEGRAKVRKRPRDILDPSPAKVVKTSGPYKKFILTDHAGNVARIVVLTTTSESDGWTTHKFIFVRYRYNDEDWHYFKNNERCAIKLLTVGRNAVGMVQFATDGTWRLDAVYSEDLGNTTITIQDGSWSAEMHTGIKVADIVIHEGVFDYRIP